MVLSWIIINKSKKRGEKEVATQNILHFYFVVCFRECARFFKSQTKLIVLTIQKQCTVAYPQIPHMNCIKKKSECNLTNTRFFCCCHIYRTQTTYRYGLNSAYCTFREKKCAPLLSLVSVRRLPFRDGRMKLLVEVWLLWRYLLSIEYRIFHQILSQK